MNDRLNPASVPQAAAAELELLAAKAAEIARQLSAGREPPQTEVAGLIVQAARMRARLTRIEARLVRK